MNTKLSLSAAALALAGFGATCLAQNLSVPATPAAAGAAAIESRAPDRIIYLGTLPTPAELTQGAAARGVSVVRMEQTDRRIVAYYQTPGGAITADAYELLTTAGVPVAPAVPSVPAVSTVVATPTVPMSGAAAAQVVSPAPVTNPTTIVVPTSPAPPVVYYNYPAPTYYYANPDYYSYPAYYRYPSWGWYAPIGVSLNFGWHGGGHYGGGFRYGGGGHRFHR